MQYPTTAMPVCVACANNTYQPDAGGVGLWVERDTQMCYTQPFCGFGEKASPDSSVAKRTCQVRAFVPRYFCILQPRLFVG